MNDECLKYVNHPSGIKFCSIPFLWHYNDFAQPFPVEKVKKLNYSDFINTIAKNNINNDMFKNNLRGISDSNTDFYVVAQYRKEAFWYSEESDVNELYLSYHTWMYTNHVKSFDIDPTIKRINYNFITGVFSGQNKITTSQNITKKFGGIEIDGEKLTPRRANIHNYQGIVRFSGTGVCNFNVNDDNNVFMSVMRFPSMILGNKNHCKIMTPDNKFNCVMLHVFRNVPDNNPLEESYQKLISDFIY